MCLYFLYRDCELLSEIFTHWGITAYWSVLLDLMWMQKHFAVEYMCVFVFRRYVQMFVKAATCSIEQERVLESLA